MQQTQGCYGIPSGSSAILWHGYQSNTAGNGFQIATATYSDFAASAGTPTFTEDFNQGMGVVRSQVNSSGGILPGIVISPPATGIYEVTAKFLPQSTNTSQYTHYRLTDGVRTLDEGQAFGASATISNCTLIGLLDLRKNLGPVTVKLQGAAPGTGNAFLNPSLNLVCVYWTVKKVG